MSKKATASFIILMIILTAVTMNAQNWKYRNAIKFPLKDSVAAKPFLCALDKNGRLYVISSKVDDARAHNAIYYANPGDTVFSLFIDYTNNGDSDTLLGNIGALRGITTLGTDVYVSASQPYPKTKPNTVAALYYYKNADTTKIERFGFSIAGAGFGTFLNGIDITKDTMIVAGVDFGTSIRWYNFGYTVNVSGRGGYIPPPSNTVEPGGPQTSGLDLIRDVALVPGGDYFNKTTIMYSSRNSLSDAQLTGGIAVWKSGTQTTPVDYVPSRVGDFEGFLSFGTSMPYGITVDTKGILWVAGVDTTRRWVKGFFVDGVNAQAMYDLPSSTSGDVKTPSGAPMSAPSDVVISKDGNVAYVVDRYAKCAFKFQNGNTDVRTPDNTVQNFELNQNYPNPFNPSTLISYTLANQSYVRLIVTDLLGREVAVLAEGTEASGKHVVSFSGASLPSGIYFYTLVTPGSSFSKKMMLLK
ncbi:MAG: T9SS type A sorting domain-containing protein [Bacteroidota bacterium]